jgi:hypothetical protein
MRIQELECFSINDSFVELEVYHQGEYHLVVLF